MLEMHDIEAVIDGASKELTEAYPHQDWHIASLGAKIKDLLQREVFSADGGGKIDRIAQLFEICSLLEEDHDWVPDREIAGAIDEERATAQEKLLHLFYRRKIEADIDKQMPLRRERSLALRVARWLSLFRRERPAGMIGPAWLEQHLDPDFWEEVQWYCYDEGKGECDWIRFTDLLPRDVRAQFDHSLVPIDIPAVIKDAATAISLLTRLAKNRRMTLEELTDPRNFDSLYGEEPAFRAAIEYFRGLRGEESSRGST